MLTHGHVRLLRQMLHDYGISVPLKVQDETDRGVLYQ